MFCKDKSNNERRRRLEELAAGRAEWLVEDRETDDFPELHGTHRGTSFRITSTGLTYGYDFYFALAVDVGRPQASVLVHPDATSDALAKFGEFVEFDAGGEKPIFGRSENTDYLRALVESEAFARIDGLPVDGFVWRGLPYIVTFLAEEVPEMDIVEAIVDWAVDLGEIGSQCQ